MNWLEEHSALSAIQPAGGKLLTWWSRTACVCLFHSLSPPLWVLTVCLINTKNISKIFIQGLRRAEDSAPLVPGSSAVLWGIALILAAKITPENEMPYSSNCQSTAQNLAQLGREGRVPAMQSLHSAHWDNSPASCYLPKLCTSKLSSW